MLKYLIDDHPAGWSSINGSDFNLDPGYNGSGPACYCHGERSEEGWLITDEDKNGDQDYTYVFDEEAATMKILSYGRRIALVDLNEEKPIILIEEEESDD